MNTTLLNEINNDLFINNDSTTIELDKEINNDFLFEKTIFGKIKNEININLNKHFTKFLQSIDCVYDSERKLWIDKFGKYRETRWNWKNHSIWNCKYREWVDKNYYTDSVGNIVPVIQEGENTTSSISKVYFDKKTGDIVEKKLMFDGKHYQTEEEKDNSSQTFLSIEDIFEPTNKLCKNKICDRCEEEEKKMVEEEKKMVEEETRMLNTISTTPLYSLSSTKIDDDEEYENLNINNILWGDSEEIDRLLTHFNIKNNNQPKGLNQSDIIDDKQLDYLNRMETKYVGRTLKKEVFYLNKNKTNHLPNCVEEKAYFGKPYENKDEDEYFTQDEMLTKYNESDINKLINVLKRAPYESDYFHIPNKNRLESLKRDIKPEYIEYMFQSCYTNSTKASETEPTDKQKEVYKSIFMAFSDLFSESEPEQWKASLYNCLKSVLQMKRYNMWLLKLLFKEEVRVNMENYIYFLQHSPSSSLLKFVEKHLVDESDNTISVEEMKIKLKNKNQLKNEVEVKVENEVETKVEKENKIQQNLITDSKVSLNLRWTGGSFKVNLKNAHSSIVEDNNGKIMLDIQLD